VNGPAAAYVLGETNPFFGKLGYAMRNRWFAPAGLAGLALIAAACGTSTASNSSSATAPSSSASSAASAAAASGTVLKTATISGTTVLTNAKGFTVYSFAPDTATKSNCNGSCAQYWPPVKGPATAGSGVTGKLGTITRSDGSTQVTYDGHPLYTYVSDTAPARPRATASTCPEGSGMR
jgi:predicted lipoprotein with Yx(FWY)xxD motif